MSRPPALVALIDTLAEALGSGCGRGCMKDAVMCRIFAPDFSTGGLYDLRGNAGARKGRSVSVLVSHADVQRSAGRVAGWGWRDSPTSQTDRRRSTTRAEEVYRHLAPGSVSMVWSDGPTP